MDVEFALVKSMRSKLYYIILKRQSFMVLNFPTKLKAEPFRRLLNTTIVPNKKLTELVKFKQCTMLYKLQKNLNYFDFIWQNYFSKINNQSSHKQVHFWLIKINFPLNLLYQQIIEIVKENISKQYKYKIIDMAQ